MSWWWLVEGLVAALVVVGVLRAAQAVVPAVSGVLSTAVGWLLVLAAVVLVGALLGVGVSAVRSRRAEREWAGIVARTERVEVAEPAALPEPARALEQAPPPIRVESTVVREPARRAAR